MASHVLASALFSANRATIIEHIAQLRLPASDQWPEYARDGALISYGPLITSFYRRAGRLLAKIFRGEKPADLPVEQPDKFELIINLKTARALNLTVPQSFLVRADEVIE